MTVRKIPMRKCTGCNEMHPKKELIRVIVTPEGSIELDKTGKKNGRGAYICPNATCLEKAVKTKGLDKSLKISVPSDIYERLREELESDEKG